MKGLLFATLTIFSFIVFSFGSVYNHAKIIERNHADTTKPKTYRYILTSQLQEQAIKLSWDSLTSIMPLVGRSMSVDEAEYWRSAILRNAGRVYGSFRVTDSIEIKGGVK